MSNQNNSGVLNPRELELVARVVDRLGEERGYRHGAGEGADLAVQAFVIFQNNRNFDEAALEAALRADSNGEGRREGSVD